MDLSEISLLYFGNCLLLGVDSIIWADNLNIWKWIFCVIERITGLIAGYSGQTCITINYMNRTVVGSDWFHYYIIIWTIKTISIDGNYYFDCSINLSSKLFRLFLL